MLSEHALPRRGFTGELFPQRFLMALSLLIFNARGVLRIAHMIVHDTKSFQPGEMRGKNLVARHYK
jgi:hypothetical protein